MYEIIEIDETFARLGFFPPQCKGPTRLQLRSKETSQGEKLTPFLHHGDRLGNLFLFAREIGIVLLRSLHRSRVAILLEDTVALTEPIEFGETRFRIQRQPLLDKPSTGFGGLGIPSIEGRQHGTQRLNRKVRIRAPFSHPFLVRIHGNAEQAPHRIAQ